MIKIEPTTRGFLLGEFLDRNGRSCSVQESSIAAEDCIWLGIDNPEVKFLQTGAGWTNYDLPGDVEIFSRMELTKDQVKDLLPILHKFVDTGRISSDNIEEVSGIEEEYPDTLSEAEMDEARELLSDIEGAMTVLKDMFKCDF